MTEGETKTINYICAKRECELCEKPAEYKISYLLENARSNPASSGYRGDDISWCSDEVKYACAEHKDKVAHQEEPQGMTWASTFTGEKYPHMLLYWKEI